MFFQMIAATIVRTSGMEAVVQQDDRLLCELLRRLSQVEASLQEGDSRLIQPQIDGAKVEDPIVVPGYDNDQIDFHLRLLLKRGLIDSGGVRNGPLIGIF